MAKFQNTEKFAADSYLHEGSTIRLMEAKKYQEFLSRQKRQVLNNCGTINPEDLDAYKNNGGFKGLQTAVKEMTPEKVVEQVQRAEMRDRTVLAGSTGKAWEAYRGVRSLPHYIVATRMAGSSEAWAERTLLEGNPFALIEGMAITAYALGGVAKGIIYIPRAYKPLAFRRMTRAVAAARDQHLLGQNILGTAFQFDLEIRETVSEDALQKEHNPFICGECARALFDPEQSGEYENFKDAGTWPQLFYAANVETYMTLPLILQKGSAWFSSLGMKSGAGTKIFSLTGKTNHPCLVEAPVGVTIVELLKMADGEGSGVQSGLKAFQLGGAGGGIFPKDFRDQPLIFDSDETGWRIGSGQILIMDEQVCVVEMIRYSMQQLAAECCDGCDPCKRAMKNISSVLDRLVKGFGETGDLEALGTMAEHIKSQARCEFGKTAVNSVLTGLRFFRGEFEDHLKQRCPANFCKDLLKGTERNLKIAA